MASATLGAHASSCFGSCENSLIWIGSGAGSEIADHVLQNLYELDVESGLLLLDIGAHVGDDVFNSPLALRFQLHQDVAGIGFRDRSQTELQTGAPRRALHFRNFAKHLFDVADHAVGFCQRAARGHDVVEDESALVHLGQQVGTGKAVAKIGSDDQPGAEDEEKPRPLESAPQPAFVEVHDTKEKAAEVFFLRSEQLHRVVVFGWDLGPIRRRRICGLRKFRFRLGTFLLVPSLDEVLAQSRSPGYRQGQRRQQRNRHGHCQRAEENSGDAGDHDQRNENDNRRDGRPDQRNRDFFQRTSDRLQASLPRVAMQDDVFHHDDGVIDHQSHGCGQAAQRHQVEGLPHHLQGDECDHDGHRNHQAGD